jgi:DNA-binding transcriptional MerR regulator
MHDHPHTCCGCGGVCHLIGCDDVAIHRLRDLRTLGVVVNEVRELIRAQLFFNEIDFEGRIGQIDAKVEERTRVIPEQMRIAHPRSRREESEINEETGMTLTVLHLEDTNTPEAKSSPGESEMIALPKCTRMPRVVEVGPEFERVE